MLKFVMIEKQEKLLHHPWRLLKTQPVPSFSDLVGTGTKTTIPGERALKWKKQNKTKKQTNKNKSNKKTRADKGYLMFCGPISPIPPLNLNCWLWPPWMISFAVNISLGGGGGEWGSSSNITVFRHNYNEVTGKWLCEFSKVFQGLEKRMKGFSKHDWISVHINIPWKNSPL